MARSRISPPQKKVCIVCNLNFFGFFAKTGFKNKPGFRDVRTVLMGLSTDKKNTDNPLILLL